MIDNEILGIDFEDEGINKKVFVVKYTCGGEFCTKRFTATSNGESFYGFTVTDGCLFCKKCNSLISCKAEVVKHIRQMINC